LSTPFEIIGLIDADEMALSNKFKKLRHRLLNVGYNMIKKRLDVNDIKSVEKDDIKIQKTVNDVTVTIDYEARVPLFWNVALAFSFHKSAVMR
jgi:hypothetical protein